MVKTFIDFLHEGAYEDAGRPAPIRTYGRERGRARAYASYNPLSFPKALEIISLMILPQVHLRKPCYDFSFL